MKNLSLPPCAFSLFFVTSIFLTHLPSPDFHPKEFTNLCTGGGAASTGTPRGVGNGKADCPIVLDMPENSDDWVVG